MLKNKKIIVHLGPHKTGSTALQQCLNSNIEVLGENHILFLRPALIADAALALARGDIGRAETHLKNIAASISDTDFETVILSHEDFCGELPGRTREKRIYPDFNKNLELIARAFQPHHVRFVYFERPEGEWLLSCYHQHLKYRTRFSTFKDFAAFLDCDFTWAQKLQPAKETFGEDFISLPYSKVADAGVRELLAIAGHVDMPLVYQPAESNVSPQADTIRLLERINALSGFKGTAWLSKSLILQGWKPAPLTEAYQPSFSAMTDLATLALPALTKRALGRVSPQDIDDILPPEDVDLKPYVFDILPTDVVAPKLPRADINNQSLLLDFHLRGKSRLAKLNALTISYLRRDTLYTDKARHLFHRIWREQGHILVNELTTRWLISTLQTFLDHGENEAQRMIGASGHFYGNMMKIYEGERAIEGLEQDATYSKAAPQTPNRFHGLDRYPVGGTDLLLNTNALAMDLAMRDDVAGLVMMEFLLRTKDSGNVFTRMDRTRKAKKIEVAGFGNTWSFFDPL